MGSEFLACAPGIAAAPASLRLLRNNERLAHGHELKVTELGPADHMLRSDVNVHESEFVVDDDPPPDVPGEVNDPISLLQRRHEWLFTEYMAAGAQGGLRQVEVQLGRGRDGQNVGLRMLQQFLKGLKYWKGKCGLADGFVGTADHAQRRQLSVCRKMNVLCCGPQPHDRNRSLHRLRPASNISSPLSISVL